MFTVTSECATDEAAVPADSSERKTKRKALTLEDYRRTRGIALSAASSNSAQSDVYKQENTTPVTSCASVELVEEVFVPNIAAVQEIPVQDTTTIGECQ